MVVRHQRRRRRRARRCSRTTATWSRSRTTNEREPRELLLLAGEPLARAGRPLRPFVMTTKAEIGEAIDDFQSGRFGAIAARSTLRPSDRTCPRSMAAAADDDGAGRGAAVPGGAALARRAARVLGQARPPGAGGRRRRRTPRRSSRCPSCPSGLGWLPDGRMLVVSMHDRKLLRLDADGLTEVADLSALATWHCNDMVVDARRAAPTSATSASTSTAARDAARRPSIIAGRSRRRGVGRGRRACASRTAP